MIQSTSCSKVYIDDDDESFTDDVLVQLKGGSRKDEEFCACKGLEQRIAQDYNASMASMLSRESSHLSLFGESSIESPLVEGDFDFSLDDSTHSDDPVATTMAVEIKFSPVLAKKLSKKSRKKSSASIKETLSFGSIHELCDYESPEEDDDTSSSEEDTFYFDKGDESSVESEIINGILKLSDSRARIHNGKRVIATKAHGGCGAAQDASSNFRYPVLNHRKPTGKNKGFWNKTSPKTSLNRHKKLIDCVLVDMSSEGKVSVSPSKGKKKPSIACDPLMDRFLKQNKKKRSKEKKRQESRGKRRDPNLFASDSIQHICGNGTRVVKTHSGNGTRGAQ